MNIGKTIKGFEKNDYLMIVGIAIVFTLLMLYFNPNFSRNLSFSVTGQEQEPTRVVPQHGPPYLVYPDGTVVVEGIGTPDSPTFSVFSVSNPTTCTDWEKTCWSEYQQQSLLQDGYYSNCGSGPAVVPEFCCDRIPCTSGQVCQNGVGCVGSTSGFDCTPGSYRNCRCSADSGSIECDMCVFGGVVTHWTSEEHPPRYITTETCSSNEECDRVGTSISGGTLLSCVPLSTPPTGDGDGNGDTGTGIQCDIGERKTESCTTSDGCEGTHYSVCMWLGGSLFELDKIWSPWSSCEKDDPLCPRQITPEPSDDPVCGNGVCETGEEDGICALDCKVDVCIEGVKGELKCIDSTPAERYDQLDETTGECVTKWIKKFEGTCPEGCENGICLSTCDNDGICESHLGETTNCDDCPKHILCNNNGVCESGETEQSCPLDCKISEDHTLAVLIITGLVIGLIITIIYVERKKKRVTTPAVGPVVKRRGRPTKAEAKARKEAEFQKLRQELKK
jgi:hypothetical protein